MRNNLIDYPIEGDQKTLPEYMEYREKRKIAVNKFISGLQNLVDEFEKDSDLNGQYMIELNIVDSKKLDEILKEHPELIKEEQFVQIKGIKYFVYLFEWPVFSIMRVI